MVMMMVATEDVTAMRFVKYVGVVKETMKLVIVAVKIVLGIAKGAINLMNFTQVQILSFDGYSTAWEVIGWLGNQVK